MAKKKILTLDTGFDFILIGISSPLKDYRLCWAINKQCDLKLEREDDLEIWPSGQVASISFSFYTFEDLEDHATFHVIANKSREGWLVAEAREADYFLMIKGHMPRKSLTALISNLKAIPNVLTAYEIDPNKLKSAHNLLI
ncbi:MAG: IPExxxVDY family protein [Flavobacteriales bacterium]|nr:IPExxxVDY family protein [Flavobacteriales bacterium]